MTPITAERTASYRKLADDADAALARGDDMGVELLRALVPEITDAVEEINDGLREAVSLLFEGLRDEALGLHDAAVPEAAMRLQLSEKPQWPDMALRFQAAEIVLPPAIDFEALSAVNAAYAEVEQLRKPLARLRRLALERAPLADRIQVLRGLQQVDPARPTWADQLRPLEEARIAELGTEVAAAVRNVDAQRLAALEAELGGGPWTVPVPGRIAQQVQGAAAWLQLRRGLESLRNLAASIEHDFAPIAAGGDPLDDPDRVDRLRDLYRTWLAKESECRGLVFALPQYPVVSRLSQPEDFGSSIEATRTSVQSALSWLAAVEAQEHVLETFRERCDELHKLAAQLPKATDAAKWHARIAKAEAKLRQTQESVPGLAEPPGLTKALADARQEVARRVAMHRAAIATVIAAAVLAPVALALLFWWARR